MASYSAALARGAPPDQTSLGWLLLIPLGCLVLGQAILALTGIVPVLDGALADTDPYMRLARVLELHESGSWFDSRFPRINPPEGHVQHWTRPLDALLLAGAWLLQPFLGFDHALHLWGVLISPVCLALIVLAFAWLMAPVLDRDARLFACLALLLQPTVVAYASVGRPDHHSLLLLLFVLLLGLTLRTLAGAGHQRSAALAGAVAALAIWVSPEALVFVAISLGALGCCWLFGDDAMAPKIQHYLIALALGLAAALLIERGPIEPWLLENDRISLLHVVLFAALALMWPLVVAASRIIGRRAAAGLATSASSGNSRTPWPEPRIAIALRAGAAAAGLLLIAAVMMLLFAEVRSGPLGPVDPLYARVRLTRISEIQPLVSASVLADGDLTTALRRVVLYVGVAALSVPFLAFLLVRNAGQARRLWGYVALALGIFLALSFYQIRWSSYAQLLSLLPYSAFVGWLLHKVTARTGGFAAPLCRAPLILLSLVWPFLLVQLFLSPTQKEATACPLGEVVRSLEQVAGIRPRTVMALADYGPEILYRTEHNVLSIPNHRPQPGFAATYHALTATDDAAARSELARTGADLILLCASSNERRTFTVEGTTPTLYQRLLDGNAPDWLRMLPLEGALSADARLYEVVPAGDLTTTGLAPRRP